MSKYWLEELEALLINILDPIELGAGVYSPGLVLLSYLVAVLASFTALSLTQIVSVKKNLSRKRWLIVGAVSMGTGIWSMHFVGMLAFSMKMPFSYDIYSTALSLVIGILASGYAIHMASSSKVEWKKLCGSGLVMGLGIAGMHYTGMAAMQMQATISYDPVLLSLSIVIAILASIAALWMAITLSSRTKKVILLQFSAALIMGMAICGMHYTGMMAAYFTPLPSYVHDPSMSSQDHQWLAIAVSAATILILVFTLITILYERKINLGEKMAESLSAVVEQRTGKIRLQADQLMKQQALLNTAQEIANIGSWEWDAIADKLIFSDQMFKIVDIDPESFEGNWDANSTFLFPEDDDIEFKQSIRRGVLEKNRPPNEYAIVQSDGSVRIVHAQIQPFYDDNRLVRMIGVVQDITERKKLEAQLVQAQKMESVGQLAAGIAHEINTPIQYIGNNTTFMQESFEEIKHVIGIYEGLLGRVRKNELSDEYLEAMNLLLEDSDFEYLVKEVPKAISQTIEGIERVAKIVQAMKEFSHPGSDKKTLANINDLLNTIVTVASNEWKYVAELELNLDPSLPDVHCLPGELNQVFLNIVVNAAHAIKGMQIDRPEEKGLISLCSSYTDDWVEVQIRDTGGGIPRQVEDRVFDPFFTTKEVGKGTGQGLAIAYSVVVDKHEGEIFFDSVEGEGTTFIIRIPVQTFDSQ